MYFYCFSKLCSWQLLLNINIWRIFFSLAVHNFPAMLMKMLIYVSLRTKFPYLELFCSAFSPHSDSVRREIRSISPYSVWMRENADSNNSERGHFSRSVWFWFWNSLRKVFNTKRYWYHWYLKGLYQAKIVFQLTILRIKIKKTISLSEKKRSTNF